MKKIILYNTIFLALSILLGVFASEHIKVSSLSSILLTLQNISAAVFTLAGIWIAYIYPEAISEFTDSSSKISLIKGTEHTQRIENLVLVIFASATVLLGILFYNFAISIFINNPYVIAHSLLFKSLAMGFVTYLSLIQTNTLLSVMWSNIAFVNRLHSFRIDKKLDDDL